MAGAIQTLKEQTGIAPKPVTFAQKMEQMRPQIMAALPRHLNADRMIRIALTAMRTNQRLEQCSAESLLAAIMIASQLGLEPGIMGMGYLIPYKTTATFVPGWRGLMDLVNRAGKATAWTFPVFKGDEFDWALGDRPFVHHKPKGNDNINDLLFAYAVGRTQAMSEFPIISVWSAEKIWKHRDKINRVGSDHYSYKWPEAYATKIPLLQVIKFLPLSIELQAALSLEAEAEEGTQNLKIPDVPAYIEGTIVPQDPSAHSGASTAPNAPKSDEQTQPERKEPTVCAECRKMVQPDGSGHEAECKFAPAANKGDPKPGLFLLKKVAQKQKNTAKKEPYLVLDCVAVGTEGGDKELSLFVWRTTLHEFLVGKKDIRLVGEISQSKEGQWNLTKILELDNVRFVDDKPCAPGESPEELEDRGGVGGLFEGE